MKLRLRGNSVRLRLTQTEVRALEDGHRVEESVNFGEGVAFVYAIATSADAAHMDAHLENGRLLVTVRAATATQWARGDEVGMSAERALDEGGSLRILVEKDFACVRPREDEDEGDMFPHPRLK